MSKQEPCDMAHRMTLLRAAEDGIMPLAGPLHDQGWKERSQSLLYSSISFSVSSSSLSLSSVTSSSRSFIMQIQLAKSPGVEAVDVHVPIEVGILPA